MWWSYIIRAVYTEAENIQRQRIYRGREYTEAESIQKQRVCRSGVYDIGWCIWHGWCGLENIERCKER